MTEKRTSFIGDLKAELKRSRKIHGIAAKMPRTYTKIISNLIWQQYFGENYRLTVFVGGPLKYDSHGIKDAWFFPAEVLYNGRDGDERLNFHLIAVNCKKGRDMGGADVLYNFSTDDALKLEDLDDHGVTELHRAILTATEKKQVVVRVALTGGLVFPIITTAMDRVTSEGIKLGLNMLSHHLGYPEVDVENYDSRINALLAKHRIDQTNCEVDGDLLWTEERIIQSKSYGRIHVVEVICLKSAWKIYRLYSARPLKTINPRRRLFFRLDSGCSIGMNYLDQGCDCLAQLAGALTAIRDRDGIVVHLPTQDGRGYGDVTKIYTEGLKHGINPSTLEDGPAADTVDAARSLLGDQIDIRTYSKVGEFLRQLGFRSATILTDNSFKAESVKRGGIKDVVIESTNIIKYIYLSNPLVALNTFIKHLKEDAYNAELLEEEARILLVSIGMTPREIELLTSEQMNARLIAEHRRLSVDR